MFESVKNEDFMIVSVAMDADVEAARPWIEEASPDYVTLIDQNHLLSSLYNMVNVPQAVWIDEAGKIVRPVETGGSLDILREFDPEAGAFKPEAVVRASQAKTTYTEAVKDWAIKGSASSFVFDADEAKAHTPAMDDDMALAHAKFQLGQYLKRNGKAEEADALFAECRQLHPDSWNIFRETTERMDTGIAAGEEFWGKVMSLGEKQYYGSIDMQGMPD
jgi:hypothetical protein